MRSAALLLAALAATSTARAGETLDIARVGAFGGYYDGSRLVGHGSRQRYDGVEGGLDVDVVRFPGKGLVGYELRGQLGSKYATGDDRLGAHGLLDVALDAALLRTERIGVLVGGGVGVEAFRRAFTERVRLYPLLSLRTRAWLTDTWSLHANAHYVPVTTSRLGEQELRVELAVGWKALLVGLRGDLVWFSAGTPRRDYRELGAGFFVGAAFY